LSASPRRVLLVSASLEGGGAERQLATLANYLARRGCDVRVLTWSGPEVADVHALDGNVRRLHLGVAAHGGRLGALWFCIRCVRSLRARLRAERVDIVVSFIAAANVLTLLAALGQGLRVVVSERVHPAVDATVSMPFRLMRSLTYRFADVVVAQTSSGAEWIRSRLRAQAAVIPNVLRELPAVTGTRENLLVAVGRLARQKGFDLLLRAFSSIERKFPQWRLVILGEGPEHAVLVATRDSLGLTERVTFPGYTNEIEGWLGRAAIVVQPSRFEGFPNAVLEAMGMGAAVISSDCLSGPSELIRDGENGRLVAVEDVPALARCMTELMSNAELRERLGAAALEVRTIYSEQHVMRRWWSVLTLEENTP